MSHAEKVLAFGFFFGLTVGLVTYLVAFWLGERR